MTSLSRPVLDLLRPRRETLGIDSLADALSERSGLLRRGALIGASSVGVMLGLLLILFFSHQVVKTRMGQLLSFEAEANGLRNELQNRRTRLDALLNGNRRLAEALTSFRTSSALLTELQLRTPAGIQLLSATAGGPALVIRGRADDPLAFARINGMQLDLKRSPLLVADQVMLDKLERQNEATSPEDPRRLRGMPPPVVFQITAPFAPQQPQQQLPLLRRLGAEGMARRLQLLQAEGLLP